MRSMNQQQTGFILFPAYSAVLTFCSHSLAMIQVGTTTI